MKNKKTIPTYFLILFSFIPILSLAGPFQGAGGGPENLSIKHFLNSASYNLGGAAIHVAPRITVVNACLDSQLIHTINPIWNCKGNDYMTKTNCKRSVKRHLSQPIENLRRACKKTKAQLINGKLQNTCLDEEEGSIKLEYQLNVYRNSHNGGMATYPDRERDQFIKTINYKIPKCSGLNIN